MTSLLLPGAKRKPKALNGMRATVGFAISDNDAVYWCTMCSRFHFSTGHAGDNSRCSCPLVPDGEKVAILLCGDAPSPIRRAVITGRLDLEARRILDWALDVLDVLIEAQEVVV